MGWISTRHALRGGSINKDPKNNGSNKGPLRKITEHLRYGDGFFDRDRVMFECGHECETCGGEGKTEETCSCCDARVVYKAIRVHEEAAWNANRMSTMGTPK